MTISKHLSIAVAASIAAAASALPASAALLFTEDFQTHADGGVVAGTNGWTGDVVNVNDSASFGGSRVLDGTDFSGTVDGFAQVRNSIGGALSGTGVHRMSFDVFAKTSALPSHNNALGFGSSSNATLGAGGAYWSVIYDKDNVAGKTGYFFDVRSMTGGTSDYMFIDGPFDQILTFEVVLDGAAGEVYGVYDTGGGATETTRYAVSAAEIESIDQVMGFVDFRSANVGSPFASTGRGTQFAGAQWDNIAVEGSFAGAAVPAPAPLPLLAAGIVFIAARRRRRV
jgi:hypothetical protein